MFNPRNPCEGSPPSQGGVIGHRNTHTALDVFATSGKNFSHLSLWYCSEVDIISFIFAKASRPHTDAAISLSETSGVANRRAGL
jgi:hypothetical protein